MLQSAAPLIYRHALQLVRAQPATSIVVPDVFGAPIEAKFVPLPDLSQRLASWGIFSSLSASQLASIPDLTATADSLPRPVLLSLVKDKSRRHHRTLQLAVDDAVQLRRFLVASRSTSISVTEPSLVRVEVSTLQDELQKTRWAYRIRVSLLASSPFPKLTLTHRTLVFEDMSGKEVQRVDRGPKVVGLAPELVAGGPAFQYYSNFEDQTGAGGGGYMSGFYHFALSGDSQSTDLVLGKIAKTGLVKLRN